MRANDALAIAVGLLLLAALAFLAIFLMSCRAPEPAVVVRLGLDGSVTVRTNK